jgi:hypothetical protein
MSKAIENRLAKLEIKAGICVSPPPTVVVLFTNQIEYNGHRWQREPGEAEKDFHNGVVRELRATYPPPFIFICFGNKPAVPPDAS